jgi:nucleotide-binding universal stress UspA family protein
MAFQKILIAVDSSEYSLTAARKGLELAHQLQAKAALIFVIDSAKTLGNVDAGITHEQALIVVKKEVEQTLDQLAMMYNGAELIKLMPEGHPKEEILKTAETWQADLIVIGTHGRTGFLHLLLGSVAEEVVRRSKIPVIVVPSK